MTSRKSTVNASDDGSVWEVLLPLALILCGWGGSYLAEEGSQFANNSNQLMSAGIAWLVPGRLKKSRV